VALAGCTTTGAGDHYRLKDGARASAPASGPDFQKAKALCDAKAMETAHFVTQRAWPTPTSRRSTATAWPRRALRRGRERASPEREQYKNK